MKRLTSFFVLSFLFFGCNKNHSPVIYDLVCSPDSRHAGTEFTLTVTASDEDKDSLSYQWTASEGEFTTATNLTEVKWKSPADGAGKTFKIQVTVSDGETEISRENPILLGNPETGGLKGYVYITNFNIPVADASVKAGGMTTLTDYNGFFTLSGIPAFECELTITKQDFSVFSSVVKIVRDTDSAITAEILSVNHSAVLTGTITDQDGQPLENAKIVVLNPDGSESRLTSTTTATGIYSLDYIPYGEMTFAVSKATSGDYDFSVFTERIDFQEPELKRDIVLQKIALNGEFTDSRDNRVYQYRKIGNLNWMTENLAYLPRVDPTTRGSETDPFFYVYDYQGSWKEEVDTTANYLIYGVLYNHRAASESCPPGWRLPYQSEWTDLVNLYSPDPGKKLKSITGWSNNYYITNESGFSALPGGFIAINGKSSEMSFSAHFWTSSKMTNTSKYYINGLRNDEQWVSTYAESGRIGCSVRCVRTN